MGHDGYPGLLGGNFVIFIIFFDHNLAPQMVAWYGMVKRCGRAELANFLITSIGLLSFDITGSPEPEKAVSPLTRYVG